MVDTWTVGYSDTGEKSGQMPIGKTDEHKYLGFVISNRGDNMANINQMKRKSIGVIRKLIRKLEPLNLKCYYF